MLPKDPVTGRSPGGPTRRRLLPAVLAAIAMAFVAVALVTRWQPVSTIPRLFLSVGSTFVPLVAVLGLILAVASRRILLSVDAVFLLAITVAALTRNAVASSIAIIEVPGSDHRSLLANIAVPVDPMSTG